MGFDARDAIREADAQRLLHELDGQRALREVSQGLRMNYDVQQHQKMLRDINVRTAEMVRRSVLPSLADFNVRTAAMLRRSVSPPLADFSSHVLRQTSTFAIRDLSYSVAQAFKIHGLVSGYSAEWRLQIVQSIRTPAIQSLLKSAAAFGPIVVSPDFADDAPFDYWPDLQWLFPDTTTEPGDTIDVEELWEEVVAFAQGIAHHHRAKVLLSVISNGTRFLIRVSRHPAGAQAIGGGIGGGIGFAIGGPDGAVIGGATGPIIAYVLTRH